MNWGRGSRRLLGAGLATAALLVGSSTSTAVAPRGPTATSGPIVIGTAAAGKRLTGLSGVWTGIGAIDYRFQWSRCNAAGARCLSIRGATSPTYTLVPADVGKTVGLTVYATDSTGVAAAYASLVGPVAAPRPPLESTLQPAISGAPVVGKTVRVTTGVWSPMVATFTYAWERCNPNDRACAPIAHQTTKSHRITSADLGHALVVLVQAANAATLQNTFSDATPAVVPRSVKGPSPLTAPQVTGALTTGSELIASTGRWQGVGPVSFAFQWYRCDLLGDRCATVKRATAATYRLGAVDEGMTIGLSLQASDLTGVAVAYASLAGPVAPAGSLTATGVPVISGTLLSGGLLSVTNGTWSRPPSHYSYTWLLCNLDGRLCSEIRGATGATYTLTPADRAHTLAVEVEATSGSSTQAALSPVTGLVG